MRHYVRLSQRNYAIDAGLYPLGSCTMKHNARLNEKMARLPGFGDIHPLQPQKTVQGAIALMEALSGYLLELTGMKAVTLVAQGRRAWRAGRHAVHQGRARSERVQAQHRAGARFRARHQSGHRRLHGLHREAHPGTRRMARSPPKP